MLINEIIDLLGDENSSLTQALLKTKVLLHDLGRKELVQWVNSELNGYSEDELLPDYRKLPARIFGHMASVAWQVSNQPLPIMHLSEPERENLQDGSLTQSIEEIARLASGKKLALVLPIEYNQFFDEGLQRGVHVIRAWKEISPVNVAGIITKVRSRLLDFLLELRDQIGADVKDSDLKEKAKSVDTAGLFNKAIFGSNNTIIIGDRNVQSVSINVRENDLDSLIAFLQQVDVPDDELSNLRMAVAEDTNESGKPSWAGKTGNWFTTLLSRAMKGGYAVTKEVVTDVIAKALISFIGG